MLSRKPNLIIVAGPNGSGKTVTTDIIRKNSPHWFSGIIEINPDVIAQRKFGDWNNKECVLKAAKLADEIREKCLIEKQDLLFETVLSTREKVDYISRAKANGFFIRLVYVATEGPEINAKRVALREDQGGHGVPVDKIYSRYEKSLRLSTDAALIADRSYFVDNSRTVASSADMFQPTPIFRTNNGVIVKKYLEEESFPKWVRPIYISISCKYAVDNKKITISENRNPTISI